MRKYKELNQTDIKITISVLAGNNLILNTKLLAIKASSPVTPVTNSCCGNFFYREIFKNKGSFVFVSKVLKSKYNILNVVNIFV